MTTVDTQEKSMAYSHSYKYAGWVEFPKLGRYLVVPVPVTPKRARLWFTITGQHIAISPNYGS